MAYEVCEEAIVRESDGIVISIAFKHINPRPPEYFAWIDTDGTNHITGDMKIEHIKRVMKHIETMWLKSTRYIGLNGRQWISVFNCVLSNRENQSKITKETIKASIVQAEEDLKRAKSEEQTLSHTLQEIRDKIVTATTRKLHLEIKLNSLKREYEQL